MGLGTKTTIQRLLCALLAITWPTPPLVGRLQQWAIGLFTGRLSTRFPSRKRSREWSGNLWPVEFLVIKARPGWSSRR